MPVDQEERLLEDARISHSRRLTMLANSNDYVARLGIAAMRAPGLAAAGGIAVMLAFYSANVGKIDLETSSVGEILVSLFISLMLSVVAPGAAYLAQSCHSLSYAWEDLTWEYPYHGDTKQSRRFELASVILSRTTVFIVVCSYLSLIYAGYLFLISIFLR